MADTIHNERKGMDNAANGVAPRKCPNCKTLVYSGTGEVLVYWKCGCCGYEWKEPKR